MRTGDMIVNLYFRDRWREDNKFGTRVVFPSDSGRVLNFVRQEFPNEKGWLMEIDHALHEGKCIISVINNEIAGFACYDCSGKGYFGPFGVAKNHRGNGVGTELLYECFDEMKFCGYCYAIIGWVDDTAKVFYEKTSNALYIPDSEPNKTLYMRRIKTMIEFGDDEGVQGWKKRWKRAFTSKETYKKNTSEYKKFANRTKKIVKVFKSDFSKSMTILKFTDSFNNIINYSSKWTGKDSYNFIKSIYSLSNGGDAVSFVTKTVDLVT